VMFDVKKVESYVVEEARIFYGPTPTGCGYHWTGSNDRDVATILMYRLMLEFLREIGSLRIVEPYMVADYSFGLIVLKVAYREWDQLPWKLSVVHYTNSYHLSDEEFPWVDSFKR